MLNLKDDRLASFTNLKHIRVSTFFMCVFFSCGGLLTTTYYINFKKISNKKRNDQVYTLRYAKKEARTFPFNSQSVSNFC